MNKTYTIITLCFTSIVLFNSCDWNLDLEPCPPCPNALYDERDGQFYRVVQIGCQCWMGENLNYGTRIDGQNGPNGKEGDKVCFDDKENSCDTLGALYTVNMLNNICPNGWHLPNDLEWKIMEESLGMSFMLLDTTGYRFGVNLYQTPFEALPIGIYNTNCSRSENCLLPPSGNSCFAIPSTASPCHATIFWTDTFIGVRTFIRYLHVDQSRAEIGRAFNDVRDLGACVRCVKDN